MPKEVADAWKRSGHWKDDYSPRAIMPAGGGAKSIAELGHYALMLALGLALIQGSMPTVGARSNNLPCSWALRCRRRWRNSCLRRDGVWHARCLCYVTSDFSVLNVCKIQIRRCRFCTGSPASWGNHEGSMMLWVFNSRLFGALVAAFGNNLPAMLKAYALTVQPGSPRPSISCSSPPRMPSCARNAWHRRRRSSLEARERWTPRRALPPRRGAQQPAGQGRHPRGARCRHAQGRVARRLRDEAPAPPPRRCGRIPRSMCRRTTPRSAITMRSAS